jgi:Restriction Endonuclease associating with ARP
MRVITAASTSHGRSRSHQVRLRCPSCHSRRRALSSRSSTTLLPVPRGVSASSTNSSEARTKRAAYSALAEKGDERAASRWFGVLAQVSRFRLLDAYQLVKHFFGLSLTYPGRPLTLVYLYWEPANPMGIELFARHRGEVDRFTSLVERDESCRFAALSYAEHWAEVEAGATQPKWLDDHLVRLRRRYEVEI